MNKLKSGFTLIEILIVIAIIGVLSVSLVPNIAGAPAKARDLSKKQAVMQADAAMQAYIVTSGKPVNIAVANGEGNALAGVCLNSADATWQTKIFDDAIPSATTVDAADPAKCIAGDGTVHPKFFKDGNEYRFEIQVESAASASEGQSEIFWTGTLEPVVDGGEGEGEGEGEE